MKNQVRNRPDPIRPLRRGLRLCVLSAAALLLSACVTHYYPAPSGGYQEAPPQRDYVAVTANVPAPQASVSYYVDSVYYPWWSLDYFYLGSGFRYRYGYGGFSSVAYFGPRWGYGWPGYGWSSPWYYPPFYTAWYPSHYWRPYYHPRHHYWARQYQQRPPYGHRPVNVGYGRPDSGQRVAEAPRLRGSQNEEWPTGSGTAIGPAPGGTVGGRLGSSAAPVATPAMARPVVGTYRAPAPSTAEGPRVVSRSPGFSTSNPVRATPPSAKARPGGYDARTIRAPVYRPPLNSTTINQRPPVRSAPAAPQPGRPTVRPSPAVQRPAAPPAAAQVPRSAPAPGTIQAPRSAPVPRSIQAPRSAPVPRTIQAPRSAPRPQSRPKSASPSLSRPAPRPSPRPVAPRVIRQPSAERPD